MYRTTKFKKMLKILHTIKQQFVVEFTVVMLNWALHLMRSGAICVSSWLTNINYEYVH